MAVKKIFSFFGPPGAGKGTLAQLCARKMNFEILSVGNLCRQQVLLKTDIGKRINSYLLSNNLIDDELIVNMVNDWVLSQSNNISNLILDGFPRTISQFNLFKAFINKFLPEIDFFVFNFDINSKKAFKRTLNRLVCTNINCCYVTSESLCRNNHRVCKFCGSILKKRNDDSHLMLKKRIDKFFRHKDKLLSYYKHIGQPVEVLRIEDQNINGIYAYFVDICCKNDKVAIE